MQHTPNGKMLFGEMAFKGWRKVTHICKLTPAKGDIYTGKGDSFFLR